MTPAAGKPLRTWTARELLECAERELKRRRGFFPGKVMRHRMSQPQADAEIRRMEAICEMLRQEAEREKLL